MCSDYKVRVANSYEHKVPVNTLFIKSWYCRSLTLSTPFPYLHLESELFALPARVIQD